MTQFYSKINGIPVLSKETTADVVRASNDLAGYEARDFSAEPFGSLPFAAPFSIPVIPRVEWRERIEEMTANKSRLSDLAKMAGWKPKHQARTNFCWINGPTMAFELARIVAGHKHVPLSPASVGAKITGFRNVGGWGTQGVRYLAQTGAVPEEFWPPNAIDRRYDTPATMAMRAHHQIDDWVECRPQSFDEMMTCSLLRMPGLRADNRWSHLVGVMDPLYLPNGRFAVLCPNSGLGRNADGYTILDETFGGPSECLFIAVTN